MSDTHEAVDDAANWVPVYGVRVHNGVVEVTHRHNDTGEIAWRAAPVLSDDDGKPKAAEAAADALTHKPEAPAA